MPSKSSHRLQAQGCVCVCVCSAAHTHVLSNYSVLSVAKKTLPACTSLTAHTHTEIQTQTHTQREKEVTAMRDITIKRTTRQVTHMHTHKILKMFSLI